jgi:hypothetical protein
MKRSHKSEVIDIPGFKEIFEEDHRGDEFLDVYAGVTESLREQMAFLSEMCGFGESGTWEECLRLWQDCMTQEVNKLLAELWPGPDIESTILKSARERAMIDRVRRAVACCYWIRDHGQVVRHDGDLCFLEPEWWDLENSGVKHKRINRDEIPYAFEKITTFAIEAREQAKKKERKEWISAIVVLGILILVGVAGC